MHSSSAHLMYEMCISYGVIDKSMLEHATQGWGRDTNHNDVIESIIITLRVHSAPKGMYNYLRSFTLCVRWGRKALLQTGLKGLTPIDLNGQGISTLRFLVNNGAQLCCNGSFLFPGHCSLWVFNELIGAIQEYYWFSECWSASRVLTAK